MFWFALGFWENNVGNGGGVRVRILGKRIWFGLGYTNIWTFELDDGWPESEKGDCQAVPSKKIAKIELWKSW